MPVPNRFLGRQTIKGRVNLHSLKLGTVKGELLRSRQTCGIKCSRPSLVSPAAGPDKEPSHGLNIAPDDKWVKLNGMTLKEMIGNGETTMPNEPVESARLVGLRYITDDLPGFRRERMGQGFRYLDPDGGVVHDRAHLARIKALVIPPAWTEVWICPMANGHLQATGRDARRRKQHRYHPRWREVRDETKYLHMIAFAQALPKIRRRVAQDLKLPGLPRQKVLATVVKLLEVSLIRVGNEEYAKENKSFGLTTLRNRHVEVNGAKVRFEFRGKSGREHEIEIKNERL